MTQIKVLSGNVFDIRDVIERFEKIEVLIEKLKESNIEVSDELQNEFDCIRKFLLEVKVSGGLEKWRGDWYPLKFISDGYFETYVHEVAADYDRSSTKWPYNHINWEAAARELKMDYEEIRINYETYYY
jgi:hypothetical protein